MKPAKIIKIRFPGVDKELQTSEMGTNIASQPQ